VNEDSHPAGSPRPKSWKYGVHGLVMFIIAAAATLVFKSAFGSRLADNWSYVVAPFYAAESADSLRVVTVDDRSLTNNGVQALRDLDVSHITDLLELVARQKPAAIFLDFELERAGQRNAILEVVQKYQAPPLDVPIYVARGDLGTPLDARAGMLADRFLANRSGRNFAGNEYPIVAVDAQRTTHLMAAPTLVDVYCRRGGRCAELAGETSDLPAPLYLRWAGIRSAQQPCDLPAAKGLDRWLLAGSRVWELIANLGVFEPYRGCPPLPAKTAAVLLSATGEQMPTVNAWLAGKIVFIGDDTANDVVTTPAGFEVAGVFLHATAAENLLTQGRDYLTPRPRMFAFWLLAGALLLAMLTYFLSESVRFRALKTFYLVVVTLVSLFLMRFLLRVPSGEALEWGVSLAAALGTAAWVDGPVAAWFRQTGSRLPRSPAAGAGVFIAGAAVLAALLAPSPAKADEPATPATGTILGFVKDGSIPLTLVTDPPTAPARTVPLSKIFCSLRRTSDGLIVAIPNANSTGYHVFADDEAGKTTRYMVRAFNVLKSAAVACTADAGPAAPSNKGGTKYLCDAAAGGLAMPAHYEAKCDRKK
jgi:CHASE2 domain-containing sensor protein